MKPTKPNKLCSMLDGFSPIKNLLGIGDPNVYKIDDQWWMFFGGFQRSFKNNLFSASLPTGEKLSSASKWKITTYSDNPQKAKPLLEQPKDAEWDKYGLHEPCFAEGQVNGKLVRRIYYTGRSSNNVLGNESPYSIGCLEWQGSQWIRYPVPVMIGNVRNDSVLGPKVIYDEGRWKMWFTATPKEPAKGDVPQHEIYTSESENGIDGWTKPRLFFTREEAFAHAKITKIGAAYYLLVSRSGNLYGESSYKPQNLWLYSCDHASRIRADWSQQPLTLLEAAKGADWYRNGIFGSCLCEGDNGELLVFFSGINATVEWLPVAVNRLKQLKKPPFPAPFYFTVGSMEVDGIARDRRIHLFDR